MRATQNDIALERASHEQESQFQQRVREMLNNLPTTTRNRERFTINRTTIKVSWHSCMPLVSSFLTRLIFSLLTVSVPLPCLERQEQADRSLRLAEGAAARVCTDGECCCGAPAQEQ